MINNARDAVGERRNSRRWAPYNSIKYNVKCPWCAQINNLHGSNPDNLKKARKKVPLTVLLCPHCYAVYQYRGTLPEDVSCPVCSKSCKPLQGNTGKGAFICSSCGTKDKIINSIRKLPGNQLLPTRPYAVEGYCAECAGDIEELDLHGNLAKRKKIITHQCNIHNNRGKFFKRITPADLKKYQNAERRWEEEKDRLPYPKSEIPMGEKTKSGLIAHNYKYWYQMFNSRQLLCLSTLLKAIGEEDDQILKEMLLAAFSNSLNDNNKFCRYAQPRNHLVGVFARHDYQPKHDPLEGNIWGTKFGHGGFSGYWQNLLKGKEFCYSPFDRNITNGKFVFEESDEKIEISEVSEITCENSQHLTKNEADLVITDPPYAGNVNYSELADFFYVWLRLILSRTYPHFAPEITPKSEEIIENSTRGKTTSDYQEDLTEVWRRCSENLKDDGLMVFTFHHREGKAWEALLDSLCTASFVIEAIYPIHGESENSLHLMGKQSIAYDLIHVCKKRNGKSETRQRSWAGVREDIME